MWNRYDQETFLKEFEESMKKEGDLKQSSVRTYIGRIRWLLEHGYSVANLCGAMEQLMNDYAKNGRLYRAEDHGNTVAALRRLKRMVKHPFIRYQAGWQSLVPKGEHITEYCIDGASVKVIKSTGFGPETSAVERRLSAKEWTELVSILDDAKSKALFAASDTCICNVHGPADAYDYRFFGRYGENCRSLFCDTPEAHELFDRYNRWFTKVCD